MKFAYLLLVHKNARQVANLVGKLQSDGDFFVIHVCKSAGDGVFQEVKKLCEVYGNVYFCKRVRHVYLGWGIVKAMMNGIEAAFDAGRPFDYLHLLSGQDYPIKPRQVIRDFFMEHAGKEFMFALPMYPPVADAGPHPENFGVHKELYRIDRFHLTILNKVQSVPELESERLTGHSLFDTLKIFLHESPKYLKSGKWTEELLLLLLSRVLPRRRKILGNMKLYGGSPWWSLTPQGAKTLLTSYRTDRKLRRFYKYTLIPDEMYIQTILFNSSLRDNIVNDNLREIHWPGHGTHPTVFHTDGHFALLKSSKALFARKFELPQSAVLLEKIDQELL